ncbi:MAG: hypothetical protein EOO28_20235 [Comamonadaceae bacterium]|nr:MAG: hypothetical protein EOO28_20235 [Comamonadaceae bacterium]
MNEPSTAPDQRDQPLGLTVHTLPEPGRAAAPDTVRGRWKMLAVLLICASPVLASYFMYYVVRPEGRRNFGELIDPQRPLPALTATPLKGAPVLLTSLKDQWLLVSVSGGACQASCEQNLYLQRQLRESLGKEKERLDRVWLVNDDAAVPEKLLPALAASSVLRVAPAELSSWLVPAAGHQLEDHLYLVDPLGNWMMRFPANIDAEGAQKAKRDLDRLLRASSSWDKEGRSTAP